MARHFEGFPGQAEGKSHAHVFEEGFEPREAPPVDVTDHLETEPANPGTEPTFDHAIGLPVIPAEQAFGHIPFDNDDFPGHVPEFFF
jgi:hypothetical protein